MSVVAMKDLLEAGVHFGHQTRKWNPKMKPYIYTERNGIYIIDLQKSVQKIEEAYEFVRQLVADGGKILYVGTKKQARETVEKEAKRAGMYYINESWKGGLLTNFQTIRERINYMFEIEDMEEDGTFDSLTKKEALDLRRKKEKLQKFYNGIRDMEELPDALFIIDQSMEQIAIHEARLLGIPVVGLIDTNCDPDMIDYIIPGNDDAIRAIKLLTSVITNAVVEAKEGLQEETFEEIEQEEVTEDAEEELKDSFTEEDFVETKEVEEGELDD